MAPEQKTVAKSAPVAPPTEENVEEALAVRNSGVTLFGQLPKELAFLGKYKVVEQVGVAPTWKPTREGETLVGQIVQYKVHPHKLYDTDLIVVQGPQGVYSVWLTTDLAMKIGREMAERKAVVAIRYEGTRHLPGRPADAKPLQVYQVLEVLGARDTG